MTSNRISLGWLFLVACSGGESIDDVRTLDCEWATSEANCWLDLLDVVATCAVPDEAIGTFDSTRTRCTYAEGWTIEFETPYEEGASAVSFTVFRGADPCVRYTNRSAIASTLELEVESAGQIVRASATPDSYSLTCPAGDRYVTEDPFAVLTCGEPRGYKIPGVLTSYSTGDAVGLSIPLGEEPGGADITVPLFMCR